MVPACPRTQANRVSEQPSCTCTISDELYQTPCCRSYPCVAVRTWILITEVIAAMHHPRSVRVVHVFSFQMASAAAGFVNLRPGKCVAFRVCKTSIAAVLARRDFQISQAGAFIRRELILDTQHRRTSTTTRKAHRAHNECHPAQWPCKLPHAAGACSFIFRPTNAVGSQRKPHSPTLPFTKDHFARAGG